MDRYFNHFILGKPALYFFYILIGFNLVSIGLYFSGISLLQQIIVPTIPHLHEASWREFGLPEILQNVFLLAIIAILFCAAIKKTARLDKCLYGFATLAFLFLFLEELDYGIHYYEIITGDLTHGGARNWHNQSGDDGKQNAGKIKKVLDAATILLFVLLPLISRLKWLKSISSRTVVVPVGYFVGAIVIAVILSKFAHKLDDAGYGVINGIQGQLHNNISEFRETSMYYIYLLYALQLVSKDRLFNYQD